MTRDFLESLLASMEPDMVDHASEQYHLQVTLQRANTITAAELNRLNEAELIALITLRHRSYWSGGAVGAMTTRLLNDHFFPLWEIHPPTGAWFVDPVWRAAIKKSLPDLGPIPDGPQATADAPDDLESPRAAWPTDADAASEDLLQPQDQGPGQNKGGPVRGLGNWGARSRDEDGTEAVHAVQHAWPVLEGTALLALPALPTLPTLPTLAAKA